MATQTPDATTASSNQHSATITVYNINGFDEMKLELLFENRNRLNGGNVKSLEIHQELNVAYVTFEEQEVAERVLAKGEVKLEGDTLKISPGPKIDPYSILVCGVTPEITQEMLELYFESARYSGGGTVESVMYKEDRKWACVTFKSKEVAERVLQRKQKLSGVELTIMPYITPQAVEVYPINGLDKEVLELYFDSRRHSDGGNITSLHIDHGVAIVHFEDCDAVKRVLLRNHVVDGHELEVDVYHPQVGITHAVKSLSDNPPAPFSVSLQHPIIQQFWKHSPEVSTWLGEVGEHLRFAVEVDDGKLNVTYSSKGLDVRTCEMWKQEVSDEVNRFLARLHVSSLRIPENCSKSLDSKCLEVCGDKTLAQCDHNAKLVTIVGFAESVNEVEPLLKEAIKEFSVIENMIPLPEWQLHLMQVTNHIDYVKQRVPGLEVTATDDGLVLKGDAEQLQVAFSLLYDDFICNCVQRDFQMSDSVFGALQNRSLFDRISDSLGPNNILAVIELYSPNDVVYLHALSDADAERCAGLIMQSLVHKRLKFPAEHQRFLHSAKWKELSDQLSGENDDFLFMSSDAQAGTLDVVCWHENTSIMKRILERLQSYLTEESLLPLPMPVLSLFAFHYEDRIKAIMDNLNHVFSDSIPTTINLCDPSEVGGYIICGLAEGIEFAKDELKKLATEVVCADVPVTAQHVLKQILSSSGRAFLDSISSIHRVVYTFNDNTDTLIERLKQHITDSNADQPAATVAPSYIIQLKSGLKLEIHSRDLSSSSVDTIIIPADEHLHHTLTSVRELISKAGSSVTRACEEILQDKACHRVSVGSLWETVPGALKCNKLLHLVCSKGNLMSSADSIIGEATAACVEYIKHNNVRAVAFKVLELVPGERIPLMMAIRVFIRALLAAIIGENLTVKELELVSNCPSLSQTIKDILLQILREFSVETEVMMQNAETEQTDGEMAAAAAAAGGSSEDFESGSDSHNIRLYGLNATDVESAAKEVKEKCDEYYHNLLLTISEQSNGEISSDEEHTEAAETGLAASGRVVEDSELGAVGGGEASTAKEQYYWEYISEDGAYEPFPLEVCDLLETAYNDDMSATIEYMDEAGRRQIVDFPTMRKYLARDPSTYDTVRRVSGTYSLDPTAVPSTWDDMMPGERLKVVKLDKDSAEYKDVERKFLASGRSNIRVEKIERIQNPMLYQQYRVKKKLMDKVNDVLITNQRRLYHGTSRDAISNINTNGFNRSYCGKHATAFGRGVYFAKDASYSQSETYTPYDRELNRYCYQCLVLTGEYTKGKPDYIEPPPKDVNNPAVHYDSVVDDDRVPDVFVIFNDTQAYPEYLITFKDADR